MIWFAATSESDALDDTLPALIDLQFMQPKAAVHLIYAVGYWLRTRPPSFAAAHRERLRSKWPVVGARIRD